MAKDKNKDAPKQVATQGQSGSDPRGRGQNQNAYQQQRYEGQMDPYIEQAMGNYGRASGQAFEDYGGIMGQYRDMMGPEGYGEFAETGGFSEADKANLRARGISPIRAAYANAEREVERNRSLQGGYSPNATATLAKMAREQGQSAADATTNVEAALAEMVQKGRLAGLAGQMGAIGGQANLFGTTPGMASTFGNQALSAINSSGNFGLGTTRNEISSQELPGAFDTTLNKIDKISGAVTPWIDTISKFFNKNQPTSSTPPYNPNPIFGGTTEGLPGMTPPPNVASTPGIMNPRNVTGGGVPTVNTGYSGGGAFGGNETFIPPPTNKKTSIFSGR